MKNRNIQAKKPLWKDIRFYFVGLYILLNIVLLGQLLILQVVPMKFLIPLILVMALLAYAMWWLQYGKKVNKVNRVLGKVLIGFISLVLIIGNLYIFKANDTLSKIAGENIETEVISVIVLKENKAEVIEDLKEGSFGAYETVDKENIDATKEDINKVLDTSIDYQTYDNYNDLADALYNKDVDAIILNEAYRGVFEEKHESFDAETKVIYQHKIENELKDISKSVDVTTTPFNVYITGIDTYGPVSTRSRSDVNMLATINPSTKKIVLTSIPRDYYVPQACQGGQNDKLTHTGIFGVECTVNTMESFFGIDINYYARVNFTSLVDIVDALGGITVDNPNNFNTQGYSFSVGSIYLDGAQALAFSRERYSFVGGDRERGKNQMRVITGMVNKAISPSIITNYNNIMNAVSGSFQTNMESSDITSLIKMQLGDMSGWEIIQQAVDGTGGTDWTPANGFNAYVMYPDMTTVNSAVAEINATLGR